jgi:ribosomal protein S20
LASFQKQYLRTKNEEDRIQYVARRNESKKAVREAKQKSWEKFVEDIENNYMENKKKFWNIIKAMKGIFGKSATSIKNGENKLITDRESIMEEWRKFYEKKFEDADIVINQEEEKESIQDEGNEERNEIIQSEVWTAIKQIRTGKAAGADEIAPEFIKYGGVKMSKSSLRYSRKCGKLRTFQQIES